MISTNGHYWYSLYSYHPNKTIITLKAGTWSKVIPISAQYSSCYHSLWSVCLWYPTLLDNWSTISFCSFRQSRFLEWWLSITWIHIRPSLFPLAAYTSRLFPQYILRQFLLIIVNSILLLLSLQHSLCIFLFLLKIMLKIIGDHFSKTNTIRFLVTTIDDTLDSLLIIILTYF